MLKLKVCAYLKSCYITVKTRSSNVTNSGSHGEVLKKAIGSQFT